MTTRPLGVLSDQFLDYVEGTGPGEGGQPAPAGAPQELTREMYGGLLQPKRSGERTAAMVRLMGHFCALGETRTTIFRILSLWNEKNLPPLGSEEFEYQFNQMYSRWGAPREELTFEEEVSQVGTFDDPHEQIEALIHLLDGRRLPTMEYNLWRRRLKEEYGLTTREFDSLVRRGPATNGVHPDPQAPVDVEGERRVAATALLTDPALLNKVLQAMRTSGLVGEEDNALAVYLCATSRCMDDPMNLVLQGDSSMGKSFISSKALALIPVEEKIERQRYSGQVIVHSNLSFVHKVIYITELTGAEAAGYNIRTLESEKKIAIEVTVKKEDGTGFTTDVIEKEGPTAFIITTVQVTLEAQNATRVWFVSPDDSVEQSRRITTAQTMQWGLSQGELEPFLDAQRLLATVKVARPQPLLRTIHDGMWQHLVTAPPRIRRDHNHLIELVRTSAFLHQYQRELDENGLVIPDIRDYYIVYRIIAKSFQQSLRVEAKHQLVELMEALNAMFTDRGESIPIEELANQLGWSRGKTYDWLGAAMESGRVRRENRGAYMPTMSAAAMGAVLPHPSEVIDRDPALARGQELVDPITGEELVFEP